MIIQQDKVEHWAFGFVLTFFALVWEPLAFTGIIFAYGKEIYDWRKKGNFDWDDANATVVGAVSGASVLLVMII